MVPFQPKVDIGPLLDHLGPHIRADELIVTGQVYDDEAHRRSYEFKRRPLITCSLLFGPIRSERPIDA